MSHDAILASSLSPKANCSIPAFRNHQDGSGCYSASMCLSGRCVMRCPQVSGPFGSRFSSPASSCSRFAPTIDPPQELAIDQLTVQSTFCRRAAYRTAFLRLWDLHSNVGSAGVTGSPHPLVSRLTVPHAYQCGQLPRLTGPFVTAARARSMGASILGQSGWTLQSTQPSKTKHR